MGMEISCYLDAAVRTIGSNYTGWPVFKRGEDSDRPKRGTSQVRKIEDAWSVEIGVSFVEMMADGYNNRAKLQCRALVRYAAKAITHDSLPQAMDIAASMGAYIVHATMLDDSGAAVGEIVRDVRVFPEAEVVFRNGVRAATGAYQVIVQWEDETVVTPDIEIQGYTVTSPSRPQGQPGIDYEGNIEGIEWEMPPDESRWTDETTASAIATAEQNIRNRQPYPEGENWTYDIALANVIGQLEAEEADGTISSSDQTLLDELRC